FLTAKYSPAGDLLWAAGYDGPGFGADRPRAIAVDRAGNVVVTGPSHGGRSALDYATIKYDRDGKQLWVARYDDPIQSDDSSSDVSIDMLGNVLVTGNSKRDTEHTDCATVKYDADGKELRVARFKNAFFDAYLRCVGNE